MPVRLSDERGQSPEVQLVRVKIMTENDSIEDDLAILDAARHENDAGDIVLNAAGRRC